MMPRVRGRNAWKVSVCMSHMYRAREEKNRLIQSWITIQGPLDVMDDFKAPGVREEACPDCPCHTFFIFNPPTPRMNRKLPKWEWRMNLEDEAFGEIIRFQCLSGEKMPDGFLTPLWERWPELEFSVDTWAHDETRTYQPEDAEDEPSSTQSTFSLN